MMDLKIIKRVGEAILVEWRDEEGVHRATLPADSPMTDPEQGIPYGRQWEEILSPTTVERKAQALREAGIWTARDLRQNIQRVRAALQDQVETDLAALLRSIR